jgi:hypothetical protein
MKKWTDICIMEIPEGEEKERNMKLKVMAENSLNLE